MDLNRLAPWNWFMKEQDEQQALSQSKRDASPATAGPMSPLLQLHREIDRLFDDAFRGFGSGFPSLNLPQLAAEWQGTLRPALDIQETAGEYRISLEVPGVEEKDIHVTLEDDVLVVRGEKRQEQVHKDGHLHRVERSYGSFQRVLNLPENANRDAIKANFKNGVLTLTMEKIELPHSSRGRTIPIGS